MEREQTMQHLLTDTRKIVAEQLEKDKKEGKRFNVFSILKMESKENSTHSAFLKELLDPKGTHLYGDIFLKLFLETVNNVDIVFAEAKVKVEHSIGPRNDIEKKGGRIDIYIWDRYNCICIENKINAPDQNAQLERYCSHNKGNNKVYYLNLFGEEPSDESKGELESGKDFFIISYKNEIVQWLRKCLEVCNDNSTILRESIKQYILLIEKLTNNMDKKEDQELKKLMLKNFIESQYISSNFISLKEEIGTSIRNSVREALTIKLGKKFEVFSGEKIQNENAQIWIKYKDYLSGKLYFGIQSFSYNARAGLEVGILNEERDTTKYSHSSITKDDNILWPYWVMIKEFEGYNYDFDDGETLYNLYSDDTFKLGFVNHIVNEVESFIQIHDTDLLLFLDKQ